MLLTSNFLKLLKKLYKIKILLENFFNPFNIDDSKNALYLAYV